MHSRDVILSVIPWFSRSHHCPQSERAKAGLLGCKYRVWTEKVVLVSKIIHQKVEGENYAQEVLIEQFNNGWGGVTEEVVKICQTVGLKNA